MSKKNFSVNSVVATETQKRVSAKVSVNVDSVNETANKFDEEENESPKKAEVFAEVRALFGFSLFDRETAANALQADWVSGKITFKELTAKLSKLSKGVNKENEKLENKSFELVCETIEKSSLISDFSLFVGTSDLKSLKERLTASNNRVILYHGTQSEESEKFETIKVTKKGLHKPYSDICYISYAEMSTSNIIKAFRYYGYYLASLRRVNRQIANENRNVENFKKLAEILHKDFGYMPDDFDSLLKF